MPQAQQPPAALNDIVAMPAHALSDAIRQRRISCREVMRAYLDHIDRVNPKVNAIVARRDEAELLREADERDAQLAAGQWLGWLHGMPQAPKDLTAVRGMVTSMGSLVFKDQVPARDSIIVERMRRAGAIFIGRTNVPEFGLGSHTYNRVYGTTRNPYDLSRSAGGSSGGAAAALAARMLPVADGSDFGGSLRNPAGFCNVYGFRPSAGRVPSGPGGEVFLKQLSYEGPMGRTPRDVALLLSVLAGHDPRAPLSLSEDPSVFREPLDADMRGRRVGWLGDWNGYLPMEDGILDLCRDALAGLQAAGCEVAPLTVPFEGERLWRIWLAHRHLMVGGQYRALCDDPARRERVKPALIWEVEGLSGMTALDVYRAAEERSAWYEAVLAMFREVDYLAVPTAQVFPFDADLDWPREIAGRPMDTYHRWMEVVTPWTLAGCPVISVPAGFNPAGLPMGMQLIGPPRGDLAVLRLAHAYERQRDWVARRPPQALWLA
ncbi:MULTISPECIES: amidase [unclassified Achromobacter]|jgi:amidase|uniref:amidase n=1 Tax=unclassified Achromobacter TaxID=2626865 RepID=UPI00069D5582|nr:MULTISPECIES: amidase [unclassified Achromobacter]KOF51976.1 amidase [Achromobacter sp. DMS1]